MRFEFAAIVADVGDDVDDADVVDVGECRGGEVVRVPAGGWPGWPD